MKELLKIAELIDRARNNIDTYRQSTTDQLTELLQFAKDVDQRLVYVEKELDDFGIQIEKRKDVLAETKRKIKDSEKMNLALEKERDRLQLSIEKLKQQVRTNEKELSSIQKQLEKLEEQNSQRRMELQEIMNQVQSVEMRIKQTREANETTIAASRHERDEAERSLRELRKENVVIDYLLNEGLRNVPEVNFLALLIQKTEVTLNKLRSESKISIEAANDLVNSLQSKGIITIQTDGNIRFLKPL